MKRWPGSADVPGMARAAASAEKLVNRGFVQQMLGHQRRALVGVWMVIFLLLLGVATLTWMQLQSMRAQQRAVTENALFNLTRVNAEHALRTLRAADQTLLFVMSQYKEHQGQLDLAAMVASGVIDASLFAQVGIIDAKGINLLSSVPFVKGLDLSDRPHFKVHQAADTQALYVSQVVLGRASGKQSMQLTRRINKADGSFAGVAVVSVNIDYFTQFYDDLRLPEKSAAILVGLDGEIRARQSDDHSSSGQDISGGPMLKLIASGQVAGSYAAKSLIDGVERVNFFRTVSGYPLVVNIGFSTEVVAALQRKSQTALLLQASGLCLLLLVVGALASFYMVRMQNELGKRQRMTDQLRTSDARLGLALLGGDLCVWEWDFAQARFTRFEQIAQLLGYQKDELLLGQASLVSFIAPEDIDQFFKALLLHLHGKSAGFKNECRLLHKDGRWVWISITCQVIDWDDEGRATALSGTAQDVTWRVEASQALARSEERWALAVSGSNEGIWDWDVHARKIFVSNQFCELLGHEGVVGGMLVENWGHYLHPDDVAQAHQRTLDHFKGRTDFYRAEFRLQCQDGSYKWMLIRGRVQRNKQGLAVRMIGSANDISLQRAALAHIQDQNERLNAIFSLSPDALVCFDQGYRVTYANPGFERLTGLAVTSVMGLSQDAFTEKINSLCAPTRLFGGLATLEELPGAADTAKRTLIELVSPSRRVLRAKLQHSGSTSASHILYLRDVTHETIVEEMKSEFLATAAHELRTPMASILGFSEVLLTHQLDAAQNKEFLNIIHTQSQQMSSILDELLDLARIEARQDKDFVFETLNLPVLVNEVVHGFSLPAGRVAPPVVVLPRASIKADRAKARQAILNVLSNAYKYSPPGATVSIHFAKSHHQDKGLLMGITVLDQGCGMTREQLGRVFERFYRADVSGKAPGTGLGMSIVKEIMEIHGGDILIDSVFGVGTSVTLLFPCADPQDLPGPEAMVQTLHSPA